jgi:hypothetical protein
MYPRLQKQIDDDDDDDDDDNFLTMKLFYLHVTDSVLRS